MQRQSHPVVRVGVIRVGREHSLKRCQRFCVIATPPQHRFPSLSNPRHGGAVYADNCPEC
jgi:hypothetical protein